MKKLLLFFSCFIIAFSSIAQFKTPTLYLQAGVALPSPATIMSDYYSLGLGGELQCLLPIKKKGFIKASLLANTGYYTFSGRERIDIYGNTLKADRIGYIPLHGGLRLDLPAEIIGLYASYAVGIADIDGPTGGTRNGHDLQLGMWVSKFDFALGFNTWTGSAGDKFKFITVKMGFRLR